MYACSASTKRPLAYQLSIHRRIAVDCTQGSDNAYSMATGASMAVKSPSEWRSVLFSLLLWQVFATLMCAHGLPLAPEQGAHNLPGLVVGGSRPTDVLCIPSDGVIMIEFVARLSVDSAYLVTLTKVGSNWNSTQVVDSPPLQAMFSGLVNGVIYEALVQDATNPQQGVKCSASPTTNLPQTAQIKSVKTVDRGVEVRWNLPVPNFATGFQIVQSAPVGFVPPSRRLTSETTFHEFFDVPMLEPFKCVMHSSMRVGCVSRLLCYLLGSLSPQCDSFDGQRKWR